MPRRPPVISGSTLWILRFQVNEAIRELSDYIEEIYGIDEKQFTIHNDIDANNHTITHLSAPVDDSDAVPKDYVDDSIADVADAQFLVLAADADLPNERVFTLGNGLDAVDSGAGAAYTVTVDETELNHNLLGNLDVGDVHTHYLLLAGRAGGQIAYGGTGAAENLTFYATSHATPGIIYLSDKIAAACSRTDINPAAAFIGQGFSTTLTQDAVPYTDILRGLSFATKTYGAQDFTTVRAIEGTAYHYGAGTITTQVGFVAAGGNLSSGIITNFYGGYVQNAGFGAGGTIGTAIGFQIKNMALFGSPVTTKGLDISASTTAVGTTKYGLYIGDQDGATTNYSIYTAGGACLLNAGAATVVPLTLRGAAAHSVNLFQVQSSTPANLIEVDSSGKVGIGVDPSEKLHLLHSGAALTLRMDNYGTGVGTVLEGRRARGTLGSELQVFAATSLLTLDAYGWYDDGLGDAGWSATARASISAESMEAWTPTAQATRWMFRTTPIGSIVPVIACKISEQQNLVLNPHDDPTSMQFGLAAKLSVAPTAVTADSVALYTKDANSAAGYSWWHGMGEKDVEHVMVGAIIRVDAGDPTVSHETAMCVNYADDTVKIVRESAWRQFLFTDIMSYDDNLIFYDDELVW